MEHNKKVFKILSIDGGGIKGLYASTILEKFEEKYGCLTSDHFDLLCGTSTGGLIALALSLKVPAKTVSSFYLNKGPLIFSKNRFSLLKQIFYRGKYSEANLKKYLHEIFEDKVLGESHNLLCIPAFNLTDSNTCVFKFDHIQGDYGRDNKVKYVDIALATSAAPTYFPLCEIADSGKQYVDGGLWANNPSLVGLTEAISHFVGPKKDYGSIELLSIGSLDTIKGKPIYNNRYRSAAQWRSDLINPFFVGQSLFTHNTLNFLQNHSDINLTYHRIPSTNISKEQEKLIGMDIVTERALTFMKGQGLSQANDWYRRECIKKMFTTNKTYITQQIIK